MTLLVLERDGEVTYGGLLATVGDRAWDLSAPLPLPDAEPPRRATAARSGHDP